MKILRFFARISAVIFGLLCLASIIIGILIFSNAKKEIPKNQCIISNYPEQQLKQIFDHQEISYYNINQSCNHLNATIEVVDALTDKELKAVLMRLSVIKKNIGLLVNIQVFVEHNQISYIALIDNGELIFANK